MNRATQILDVMNSIKWFSHKQQYVSLKAA
jgi:hypothetical protein